MVYQDAKDLPRAQSAPQTQEAMTKLRTLYAAAQRWMCDPQTTINRFLGPILSPRRYDQTHQR